MLTTKGGKTCAELQNMFSLSMGKSLIRVVFTFSILIGLFQKNLVYAQDVQLDSNTKQEQPLGTIATQTPSGMLLLCPCNSEESANQVATSPGAVLLCPCTPGTNVPAQQKPKDTKDTLENEFNAFGAPESSPESATQGEKAGDDQLSLDDQSLSADAASELTLEDEAEQPAQIIDVEYALDGFSAGVMFFNQNYNLSAEMIVNGFTKVNLSTKSADFQSVGVMGRYAVLPYGSIGTDINVSVASTINHSNANFAAILTGKAELNLAYTFKSRVGAPIYIFGGLGVEYVSGREIQALLAPTGSLLQLGAGTGVGKKFNIEVLYSYAKHAVSDAYMDNSINTAVEQGATSVSLDRGQASVSSNVILGRMSYNF